MAAVLIDTNVLVYAHDRSAWVKQAQAIRVLTALQLAGSGRLSVQSLSEFFSAVTRGPRPKLTVREAAGQVRWLAGAWPVLDITRFVVLEAIRGVRDHRLAFWDAQLWATARLNQIPAIFSEDFSIDAELDGIRFVNPFAVGFVLEAWA